MKGDPRRELKVHGAEPAGFAQDLEHGAKLAPERELNLRRDVFVVDVLLGDRTKRVADLLRKARHRRLVPREEAIRLDVENELRWCPLDPEQHIRFYSRHPVGW